MSRPEPRRAVAGADQSITAQTSVRTGDDMVTVDIRDGEDRRIVELHLTPDQAWRMLSGNGLARGTGTVHRVDEPCAHPHVRNPELGAADMPGNRPISPAAITAASMVLHEQIGTDASRGETSMVLEYAAVRFERGEIQGGLDTLARITDRTGAYRLAAVLHAHGRLDPPPVDWSSVLSLPPPPTEP